MSAVMAKSIMREQMYLMASLFGPIDEQSDWNRMDTVQFGDSVLDNIHFEESSMKTLHWLIY